MRKIFSSGSSIIENKILEKCAENSASNTTVFRAVSRKGFVSCDARLAVGAMSSLTDSAKCEALDPLPEVPLPTTLSLGEDLSEDTNINGFQSSFIDLASLDSTRDSESDDHKNGVPTVDIIVRDGSGCVLLEKRGREPFKGLICLPGGHVDYGEKVEDAALRELKEECSIDAELYAILGVYSDPSRDPRGQRITTVFVADWRSGEPKAGDDADSAFWMDLEEIRRHLSERGLGFDHSKILDDFMKWSQGGNRADLTFWSSK